MKHKYIASRKKRHLKEKRSPWRGHDEKKRRENVLKEDGQG